MPKLSGYPLDAAVSDVAYNATFTVYRATRTPNDSGGVPQTWSLVSSGEGRARELSDNEKLANETRKDKISHKLYCGPTLDVQRGDVVVVTNAPAGGAQTFLVVHPHLPDNVMHHFEIKAKSFLRGSSETPTGFVFTAALSSDESDTVKPTEASHLT